MSTESTEDRKNEELSPEELSSVTGGEDGGFRHENAEILGEESDRLLDQKDLTKISAGEDGGFRHQNPGFGPSEGIIQ